MTYSTDEDLVRVQKDILNLGVTDWIDQHIEAASIIDRTIRDEWFNVASVVRGHTDPFDPDLLLPEELTRLSVYKTLELAYLYVMQDFIDENQKESKHELFKSAYKEELSIVLAGGISYDWNNDGSFDSDEVSVSSPRVIKR